MIAVSILSIPYVYLAAVVVGVMSHATEVPIALATAPQDPSFHILEWATLLLSFATAVALCCNVVWTRKHNLLSVKPLPHILAIDSVTSISVQLFNYGSGPMICKAVDASFLDSVPQSIRDLYPNGIPDSKDLFRLMPPAPTDVYFVNYAAVPGGRAIAQGNHIDLLEFACLTDPHYARMLRKALGEITLTVTYSDIYDQPFEVHTERLDWFTRSDTNKKSTPKML